MNALDNLLWAVRGKASAFLASAAADWKDANTYKQVKDKTGGEEGIENLMGLAGNKIWTWAGIIVTIIGAIMVFLAILKLFKKFGFEGSPEQGQPPKWSTIIALFVIGGGCMIGGISLFTVIANGFGKSVNDQLTK